MKKMDEMQMHINLRSIKQAWFYTVIFLGIWGVYESWSLYKGIHNRVWNLPLILLITQNLVYAGTNFFLTRRMNKIEK